MSSYLIFILLLRPAASTTGEEGVPSGLLLVEVRVPEFTG